jgi:hypothetical protein
MTVPDLRLSVDDRRRVLIVPVNHERTCESRACIFLLDFDDLNGPIVTGLVHAENIANGKATHDPCYIKV